MVATPLNTGGLTSIIEKILLNYYTYNTRVKIKADLLGCEWKYRLTEINKEGICHSYITKPKILNEMLIKREYHSVYFIFPGSYSILHSISFDQCSAGPAIIRLDTATKFTGNWSLVHQQKELVWWGLCRSCILEYPHIMGDLAIYTQVYIEWPIMGDGDS